jgi:hypothetical protein
MFFIGSQKRTSRLFPFGRSKRRAADGRPKQIFRPQVEMLEGRALPSTTTVSLGAPVLGAIVADAASQPAPTVSVVLEATQVNVLLASPSQAARNDAAEDNHPAASALQDTKVPETSFIVEFVFRPTVVVLPVRELTSQSPSVQVTTVSQPLVIAPTVVTVVTVTEPVITDTTEASHGTSASPVSTIIGPAAAAPVTSVAIVSAPTRVVVVTLVAPASLGFGDLPLVNTATAVAPGNFQTTTTPAPSAAATLAGSVSGVRVEIASTNAAGPTLPADDNWWDDEPGPAMPPLVNPPEPETGEMSTASASGESQVLDDASSSPVATEEPADPDTPLVELGDEGVARVPELAAAVAVFTAGLGLFPVRLPTELEARTPRRRRSA